MADQRTESQTHEADTEQWDCRISGKTSSLSACRTPHRLESHSSATGVQGEESTLKPNREVIEGDPCFLEAQCYLITMNKRGDVLNANIYII